LVMLDMCRNLGFEVKVDAAEPDICNVRLKL
jgi:acetyltransferase